MVETDNNAAAGRHRIAEELPIAIWVVGYESDWFRPVMNVFGKNNRGMRAVSKLPVKQAAVSICSRPEVFLNVPHRRTRLHQRLVEMSIETLILRGSIFEVGIDNLKHGILCPSVVPGRPIHQASDPLRIDRSEFAIDIAYKVGVASFGEINARA